MQIATACCPNCEDTYLECEEWDIMESYHNCSKCGYEETIEIDDMTDAELVK